jgi:UDP-N-acetylmuramoylalanine--D-glutamate ligase
MAKSRGTRARIVRFSPSGRIDEGFVVAGDWIVKRTTTGDQRLVPVSAIELTGSHMRHNVTAAVAVSAVAGVDTAAMAEALRGFHGLPHVMEPAGTIAGVRFVNDSKATNVAAARRSIESFSHGVVAIIGGRYKGGDFGELREPLRQHGRAVVAIGEAAPRVREAVAGIVPVIDAASMEQAVARAFDAAKPDGVVVLAPACSSFDWFTDYAARGEAFKAAVKELK